MRELTAFTPEERQVWADALGYYRQEIVQRDLIFDDDLVATKERLSRVIASDGASLAELPPRLAATLKGAMEVYRKHWWPRHDKANRAWLRSLVPKLEMFEETLVAGLARAYGGSLPPQRVRLDASAYSASTGAYTTVKPNHTVSSSGDPDIQGDTALEIVIHELSHVDELEIPVREFLTRAFASKQGTPPRDLWHLVIFYTACDLTRTALRDRGSGNYVCYAERSGLLERTPRWKGYMDSLDRYWKPVLAGRLDREAGAESLAADAMAAGKANR